MLHQRQRRALSLLAGAVALGWIASACVSPDRGEWAGTFDGTVRGVVEFAINTRGTKLRGSMQGETREGQPFVAKLEGTLRRERIEASFRGTSRLTGFALPVAFSGEMAGYLSSGEGSGDWQAELIAGHSPMAGTWQVSRSADDTAARVSVSSR